MNPQSSRYYTYIKPFLRNKNVRAYSSLVFSIITITIFSIFAIKPTLSTIVSLQKSITEQQQILDTITKKEADLAKARKNYQDFDEQTRLNLLTLMPTSTNLPNLIDVVSSLAKTYDASVSAIQIQPIDLQGPPVKLSKKATIKEVDFTFNIQGSYQKVYNVIENLTNLNRLISIESINLGKQPDSPITTTINAKAYFFKN